MKRSILTTLFMLLSITNYAQNSSNENLSIQLIKNATVVFNYSGNKFLIDPLLADKGTYPGFQGTANSHLRNPLVELPVARETLLNPDAIIVTHLHQDHWDSIAINSLPKHIPIFSQNGEDVESIKHSGFKNVYNLEKTTNFGKINIKKVYAQHGTDEAFKNPKFRELIGLSSGIMFSEKGNKSVYFAGDAVWNKDFEKHLIKMNPDVVVLNTGYAQVDGFGAIIMGKEDVLKTHIALPNAKIIAIHMDAINHCILSREELNKYIKEKKLEKFVFVPYDGEIIKL